MRVGMYVRTAVRATSIPGDVVGDDSPTTGRGPADEQRLRAERILRVTREHTQAGHWAGNGGGYSRKNAQEQNE